MSALDFEWDALEATANLRKHGVSFDEARTVFDDEEALWRPDDGLSVGEERFILLGLSAKLRVLVVVHCEREGGDVIRLISARKADPSERAQYSARRLP
jgi:uncharacterized DUF497 family protein